MRWRTEGHKTIGCAGCDPSDPSGHGSQCPAAPRDELRFLPLEPLPEVDLQLQEVVAEEALYESLRIPADMLGTPSNQIDADLAQIARDLKQRS